MTTPTEENGNALQEIAERVAISLDADVLVYNGPIDTPVDRELITSCRQRRRRKNVLLILVTEGGDADSAYRIARCLQTKYERFHIYVTGYCKSAGTLVAVGAHEIIFGDDGELGPLDVQLLKEDSLWERQSGLTVNTALTALQSKAYLAFEEFFLATEHRSGGSITVKTAAEMATNLTIGLFAPLYSQINPIHVGETARAMQIADLYGRLLTQCSQNCSQEMVDHLVSHYPSHSFVIDKGQAETIFRTVRAPGELEAELAAGLGDTAILPLPASTSFVKFLSSELGPNESAVVQFPETEVTLLKDHDDGPEPSTRTTADRPFAQPRARPAQDSSGERT